MLSEAAYCRLAEIHRLGGVGGYTGDEPTYPPARLTLRTMSRKARWRAYVEHRNDYGNQALPFGEWIARYW